MALKFGTSGVRGLVTEFTDKEAYLLTEAFLQHANVVTPSQSVSVGMDLRESSPQILKAVEKAIADNHKQIKYCGVLPTPALAFFASENNSLAIMITGSHIPADRNGIKFYLTTGETLKKDDEQIYFIYENLKKQEFKNHLFNSDGSFAQKSNVVTENASDTAKSLFVQRYVKALADVSLAGTKVILYEHSSAAREILGEILEKLGAQVIRLGRSEKFIPVDTEAVESLDIFKKWIQEQKADALISTDGDGDRPLVVDNTGTLVQGDKLGIICSEFLGIEAIALPISCNSGVSSISKFKKIVFTKIGSPFVVEALNNLQKDYTAVAGFEANGGYILSSPVQRTTPIKALPTRDSVIPVVAILASAKQKNCAVSEIVASLPHRFTSSVLAKNCPPEKSQKILQKVSADPATFLNSITPNAKIRTIDTLDGFRITNDQNQVIHLRPSGNAPEFRCYTEANDQEIADKLSNIVLGKIIENINS